MNEMMPGQRERAKEGRRQALLEATRTSLKAGEFSMRRVAELAKVSEVTPYNLFGSKGGLLTALYCGLVQASEARLPSVGAVDPLARVFAAIDGFRDNLAADPAFYRAFFAARLESRGGRSHVGQVDEGVEYWRRLIGAAIDTGQIDAGPSGRALPRHFIHILGGVMQEWIEDAIDIDEWRALVAHGFALLALPLASDNGVAFLQAQRAEAAAGLRR